MTQTLLFKSSYQLAYSTLTQQMHSNDEPQFPTLDAVLSMTHAFKNFALETDSLCHEDHLWCISSAIDFLTDRDSHLSSGDDLYDDSFRNTTDILGIANDIRLSLLKNT